MQAEIKNKNMTNHLTNNEYVLKKKRPAHYRRIWGQIAERRDTSRQFPYQNGTNHQATRSSQIGHWTFG